MTEPKNERDFFIIISSHFLLLLWCVADWYSKIKLYSQIFSLFALLDVFLCLPPHATQYLDRSQKITFGHGGPVDISFCPQAHLLATSRLLVLSSTDECRLSEENKIGNVIAKKSIKKDDLRGGLRGGCGNSLFYVSRDGDVRRNTDERRSWVAVQSLRQVRKCTRLEWDNGIMGKWFLDRTVMVKYDNSNISPKLSDTHKAI